MTEAALRDRICRLGASFFDRGLVHGSAGNISARTADGGLLLTPTGSSLGRLDPARLARLDARGQQVSGDPPSKEMPLHVAFHDTRARTGAVVHLHCCHAVALSILPGADAGDFLPALTPYSVMLLGRVRLLPFFLPGDPAIGAAVRALAGRCTAVMLAGHGPVVAGRELDAAADAIEEFEASARLALLTRGLGPQTLPAAAVAQLAARHDKDETG